MLTHGKNLPRVLLALVAVFALIITGLSPLFTGNVAHAADNNQQGAKPGFTTFTIVKRLHGATDKVSPDTKFRVAVRWILPDRMTIADYPNWTPPANPTFMDLTVNTPTPFPTGGAAAFPDGTTIMLEEQLDATTPALPSGLEFGQTSWVEGKRTTHSRKYETFVGPENQLIELHNTVALKADTSPDPGTGDDNGSAGTKPTFGTFSITAKVFGTAAMKIPADKTFRIAAEWKLPEGKTEADYPGWKSPTHARYLTVPVDVKTPFPVGGPNAFPVGTTITLTNLSSNIKDHTIENVRWGSSTWMVGKVERLDEVSFVITKDETLAELRNEAIDYSTTVSVGDFVWWDKNGNGLQDDGSDSGIGGVILSLSGPKGPLAITQTKADGSYSFSDLPVLSGTEKYTVSVIAPAGFEATKANQGGDRSKDSSTGSADSGTLINNADNTLDFGFVKKSKAPQVTPPKNGAPDGSSTPDSSVKPQTPPKAKPQPAPNTPPSKDAHKQAPQDSTSKAPAQKAGSKLAKTGADSLEIATFVSLALIAGGALLTVLRRQA